MSFWIDTDQGTCRFDEESFIDLLEFCGRFAPNQETAMANQGPAGGVSVFYSDFAVSDPGSLVLRQFYERWSEYGTDGVLVPSPTNKSAGYYIMPDQMYSVLKTSESKEKAGAFMQWVLSEENQDRAAEGFQDGFGMPVRIDSYQKLTEIMKAAEKDEYSDYSDQELDVFYREGMAVFQRADHYYIHGNSAIAGMILEEGDRYFAGEITAAQAAEYIQNRVSIYLAEKG